MEKDLHRWLMTAPGAELVYEELELPQPADGEVRVKVAGCGVCHTDLGFLFGGVRTRMEPPLVLGHEVSGVVEAAGRGAETWLGREVVVPAVLPCGECELCRAGRENACRKQTMPGNDFHGGFASHLVVPARWLVKAGNRPPGLSLETLAVVADAVTTPYQAMIRAGVGAGDGVVVIGVGGIGSFGVQIAAALGARVVAADVDAERLERAARFGAAGCTDVSGLDPKAARGAVRSACKEAGLPAAGLKVFEMSGTPAGQALCWSLLSPAGTLAFTGFCLDKVPVRLSNLMAFDAEAFGNWGCRPQLYPPALDLIREGKVQVQPFVHTFPLGEVNRVLRDVREHRLTARPILVP